MCKKQMTDRALKLQDKEIREIIFEKIRQNGRAFQGLLPQTKGQSDGKYGLNKGGNWTDGFYVGIFNLAYAMTGDEEFHKFAEQYKDFFRLRIKNTPEINEANGFLALDHDVGMIFLPTAGFNYYYSQQEEDKEMLIKAANVLKERFNDKGDFIRAWDTWKWDTDEAFIQEKKGKVIDPVTGEPLCGKTKQGYGDSSCWSRGQAWAVYGFALAYKYTREERFLQIADRTAAYFMEHLSAMDMPCWDFMASTQAFSPWDSAASAICASGLLELWELTGYEAYKESAVRLLRALENFCLTDQYPKCQMLMLHGCVGPAYQEGEPQKLVNAAIGISLVYADYFYLECMLKLSDCKLRIF